MEKLPLYIFNTDPYPKVATKQFEFGKVDTIETVFTLASGFKRYKYNILYRPKNVIVYDLNPYAIEFHKRIDSLKRINFDAIKELYYEYTEKNINVVLSDFELPNLISLPVEQQLKLNWQIECKRWGGEENLVTAFLYFKQCNAVYEQIDIIKTRDKMLKYLGENNFIHISNIFSWTHNPDFDRQELKAQKDGFTRFCWQHKIGRAND